MRNKYEIIRNKIEQENLFNYAIDVLNFIKVKKISRIYPIGRSGAVVGEIINKLTQISNSDISISFEITDIIEDLIRELFRYNKVISRSQNINYIKEIDTFIKGIKSLRKESLLLVDEVVATGETLHTFCLLFNILGYDKVYTSSVFLEQGYQRKYTPDHWFLCLEKNESWPSWYWERAAAKRSNCPSYAIEGYLKEILESSKKDIKRMYFDKYHSLKKYSSKVTNRL